MRFAIQSEEHATLKRSGTGDGQALVIANSLVVFGDEV